MGNAESNETVDDDDGVVEPEGSVLLKLRGIRDKIGDHVSGIGEELVESYVTISSPAFCTEARTVPTPHVLQRGENAGEDRRERTGGVQFHTRQHIPLFRSIPNVMPQRTDHIGAECGRLLRPRGEDLQGLREQGGAGILPC